MQELSEINGTVAAVIFRNDENGYGVVKLELDNGETTTAVGCLPYVAPGEMISAEGSWMTHAQHGRQFKIEQCSRMLPTSAEAIYEYLAGGTVRGVGPATAAMIVDRFGDKALDVLEMQPDKLAEIKGISASKAKDISAGFKKQAGVRRLTEFLCSYGIQPIFALRMFKFYGNSAIEVVHENPYILASSHIGASFAEADSLALALGLDGDSLNRVCAAVVFELVHNSGNGHCFIPRGKLTAATSQLIGVAQDLAEDAVDKRCETVEIICCTVAGLDACYLSHLYEAETYTADRIKAMCRAKDGGRVNIDALIDRLETANGIKYAPMQREAIALAAQNRMLVITGGPGTGKTTILKAVLAMYDELELETYLAAPTGRAAKRMSELCGMDASTIHRMLGAKMSEDGETVVFGKDEEDKLACDALIIDECSMVDITLMHAILKALKSDCRILLVGDADQLPSVGPGNVLRDLIQSKKVPQVRLTEIFRQAQKSLIVTNAHAIVSGQMPALKRHDSDFFFLRRESPNQVRSTVIDLVAARLPKSYGYSPTADIQVIVPTRVGAVGANALNQSLQEALNPPSPEKAQFENNGRTFRVGDKVMQIKNNYDILWQKENGEEGMGVYNGDIGFIETIDRPSKTMQVRFDDRLAEYLFEMAPELELAYAITVHKSQGSEFDAVVMPITGSKSKMHYRNLLYTAVTRAKERLIILGQPRAIEEMVANDRKTVRYTNLKEMLLEQVSE